jgi:hypothetical protein
VGFNTGVKGLNITFITMLNTVFPERQNKMKDKPVRLRTVHCLR